jgi:hypothetical protein
MNRPPTEIDLIELGSRPFSDPLPAAQVETPSKRRPRNRPPMRKLSRVLAAMAAITVLLTAAPAFANSAGTDSAHVGTTEADTVSCWLPQPAGWAPVDPQTTPNASSYRSWLASSVRQRSRDGRYEVIARTDRASAPFCHEVLPGVFVANEDVPAVVAYLVSLNS